MRPGERGREQFIDTFLAAWEEAGLTRHLLALRGGHRARFRFGGRDYINFSTNNYLGLADHLLIRRAAARVLLRGAHGAGSSRLISGTAPEHTALERAAADFVGREAALALSTGYMANVGLLAALSDPTTTIFSDAANHASIIDGCRVARATVVVYPHADPDALERALKQDGRRRRRIIVTETLFSMDGDAAPLKELAALAAEYDAVLLVDEAHALGVLGPEGRGLAHGAGVADGIGAVVGTFGKAFGGFGAFIATDARWQRYLIQRCRPFIFTTALPPAVATANRVALGIAARARHRRARLLSHARRLRDGLTAIGFHLGAAVAHIIPVLVGDTARTMDLAAALKRHGVFAVPIRPPTVPEGTARVRLAVTAAHSATDIAHALSAFARAGHTAGVLSRVAGGHSRP